MQSTKVTINPKAVANLKKVLAAKLRVGCERGAEVVREVTPIDTKRLFFSTRASMPRISESAIECNIIAGGAAMYGVNREQDVKRDVDYAEFVEIRQPYIRPNLDQIEQAVLKPLK